jgi:hypothetical protein
MWMFALVFFALALSAPNLNAETLEFTFHLPEENVSVERAVEHSTIQVQGGGFEWLREDGAPELPYRIVNVLLPQGHEVVSYEITSGRDIELARDVVLDLGGPTLSEHGKAGRGARLLEKPSGKMFPPTSGRYLSTGYLHGCAIASFAVFPVRMIENRLVLNDEITLRIDAAFSLENRDVVVRERYREGFKQAAFERLSSLVINPELFHLYQFNQVRVEKMPGGFQPTSYPSLEGSEVDYLIITTDALAGDYQPLADWKTSKGVPTVVRTVEWIEANTRNGVDLPETIRFFVRDAYAKWGITYMLLGGDTDILPARYALSRFYLNGAEMPVDMYFVCLDGSWNNNHNDIWGEGFITQPMDSPDLYAEVYNGRAPCSTPAQVATMIDKIMSYETPYNRDYMDRYMFLAEVLFPVDWTPGQSIGLNGADFAELVDALALNGHPLDLVKCYETDSLYVGAVPESRQATIDSMNAGFNHVNHIGHGFRFNMSVADQSLVNVDADTLSNTDRYFNLYMLNCTAAAFGFFCLAEHFLENPIGGAVSAIGANESAFPNASSNYMTEYYDLVFNEDVVHIGEAFARSRLPRTPVASAGDNVDLWTHYIYTLLGDPEMSLFTSSVDTALVVHVPSVGLGTTNILVNVTANASPVDSALVCL